MPLGLNKIIINCDDIMKALTFRTILQFVKSSFDVSLEQCFMQRMIVFQWSYGCLFCNAQNHLTSHKISTLLAEIFSMFRCLPIAKHTGHGKHAGTMRVFIHCNPWHSSNGMTKAMQCRWAGHIFCYSYDHQEFVFQVVWVNNFCYVYRWIF